MTLREGKVPVSFYSNAYSDDSIFIRQTGHFQKALSKSGYQFCCQLGDAVEIRVARSAILVTTQYRILSRLFQI